MSRKVIIAGNWKMNKTASEGRKLVEELKPLVAGCTEAEVVVCPPFTTLGAVVEAAKGSNIKVGAQNIHWEQSGAFTGEISADMLKEAGVEYVIIGHSERRQYFGETDCSVNKRLKAALAAGLTPIVCVGELLADRENGNTGKVLFTQLEGGLAGISKEDMAKTVIAYEPVWAIGTGKTATPEMAEETHNYIRQQLRDMFGNEVAEKVRIQYGGSMKAENARELVAQQNIDGGLIGGAALKADSFASLIKNALSACK
ncbi:triose-phosphate isomerase [Victivallis sp. Marseille-Q1083]|uniref:triose-phosphate isomerase n=1 Tax=Victivallis sp. Marseille-Q1083 TaxID=2717288 RepID=UPI00158D0C48|nr:triose-phosphate isomerase [Victivallis sp. Marseille-Q1083]